MYERLIADSSFEEDTYEDESVQVMNYDLSEAENAQIHITVKRRELKHFCDAILEGLTRYVDERKRLTRSRHQDVLAIRNIIAEAQRFQTKEECMMAIHERLQRVKTGWLFFSGGSRLREIMYKIITDYQSPAVAYFSQDLILEKQAHAVLLKRYEFIRGDNVEELKHENAQLRKEGELLHKQLTALTKSQERTEARSASPQSFAAKLRGLF